MKLTVELDLEKKEDRDFIKSRIYLIEYKEKMRLNKEGNIGFATGKQETE